VFTDAGALLTFWPFSCFLPILSQLEKHFSTKCESGHHVHTRRRLYAKFDVFRRRDVVSVSTSRSRDAPTSRLSRLFTVFVTSCFLRPRVMHGVLEVDSLLQRQVIIKVNFYG